MTKPLDDHDDGPSREDERPDGGSTRDQAAAAWRLAVDDLVRLTPEDLIDSVGTYEAGQRMEELFRFVELCCEYDEPSDRSPPPRSPAILRVLDAYAHATVASTLATIPELAPATAHGPVDAAGAEPPPRSGDHLDMLEVTGSIKWFDATKGYGYIVPDEPWPDILMLSDALWLNGAEVPGTGARVHCLVVRRATEMRAVRVSLLDRLSADREAQTPPRSSIAIHPESDWEKAVVKNYDRASGIGYLKRAGGMGEIFVHRETLRRLGLGDLKSGQSLMVRWGVGSRGITATDMKPCPDPLWDDPQL